VGDSRDERRRRPGRGDPPGPGRSSGRPVGSGP